MPDCSDGGGHSLWKQGGLGGSGVILPEGRDLEHCPELPMIVPLARIPPNQLSTPGDHPDVENPRCSIPGRWQVMPTVPYKLGLRARQHTSCRARCRAEK